MVEFAHGGPIGSGAIRAKPEDFRVVEDIGYALIGAPEHATLGVEDFLVALILIAVLLDAALDHGYPHVLVGSAVRPGVVTVDSDNHLVTLDVTRALLARGSRSILFLNGPEALGFTTARANGFLEAHAELGVEPHPDAVAYTDGTAAEGQRALAERLDAAVPIDAVIAISDFVAVAAMQILRKRGLAIPDDVRVYGINDDDVGRYSVPMLSTVDLRAYELGRTAADLLMNQVEENDTHPTRRIVGHRLIERESSA